MGLKPETKWHLQAFSIHGIVIGFWYVLVSNSNIWCESVSEKYLFVLKIHISIFHVSSIYVQILSTMLPIIMYILCFCVFASRCYRQILYREQCLCSVCSSTGNKLLLALPLSSPCELQTNFYIRVLKCEQRTLPSQALPLVQMLSMLSSRKSI